MTVAEALRAAAARLGEVSDTARLDAELLMAEALGSDRGFMLLQQLGAGAPEKFFRLLERRLRHEPVAYLREKQEFYGREFRVTPAVLIPRFDSETTIVAALEAVPSPKRILDLGTGSGALLLTLLQEAPWAEAGVGIDASSAALEVAEANGKAPHLARRTRFLRRDWNAPGWRDDLGRFDLVVANPPYVEESADLAPSVRDYEPAQALYAGSDGLDAYRALIPRLSALLAPEGVAVFEIGPTQAEKVAQIADAAGFSRELRRDLANRPRALILRIRLGKEPESG